MATIFANVGSPGTVASASGGKVTGLNNVGTTANQVIGGNPQRVSITFFNPGTQNIFVAPTVSATGAPLGPSLAFPGGCFVIAALTGITFTGECQVPWLAFAASGAANSLTIMESNT